MRNATTLILAALLAAAPAAANPPPAAPKQEMDPQAKRITGSENYVPTFGLRASITRGFNVHGVLAVDAGLDIPNSKTRKRVEAIKPRLMSTLRDVVLNYASLSYMLGEKPDAEIIRARLQKAVDQAVGKGEARVALASVIVFDQ
jgi:regulator of protease activity HflC (stomatin/prohibitin superfamily)